MIGWIRSLRPRHWILLAIGLVADPGGRRPPAALALGGHLAGGPAPLGGA